MHLIARATRTLQTRLRVAARGRPRQARASACTSVVVVALVATVAALGSPSSATASAPRAAPRLSRNLQGPRTSTRKATNALQESRAGQEPRPLRNEPSTPKPAPRRPTSTPSWEASTAPALALAHQSPAHPPASPSVALPDGGRCGRARNHRGFAALTQSCAATLPFQSPDDGTTRGLLGPLSSLTDLRSQTGSRGAFTRRARAAVAACTTQCWKKSEVHHAAS
jgi:hypothetical protein